MKVQVLTDRDHVLKRPAMYIGAVNSSSFSEYIFENNKIEHKEISYVTGLIKIINEITRLIFYRLKVFSITQP